MKHTEESLINFIKEKVREYGISNHDQIQLSTPLKDEPIEGVQGLGLDSLEVLELSLAIETETGIDCSDDELQTMQTVGDMVKFFTT